MVNALRRLWGWLRRDAGVEVEGALCQEDERSGVEPIGGDELRVRAALIRAGGVL